MQMYGAQPCRSLSAIGQPASGRRVRMPHRESRQRIESDALRRTAVQVNPPERVVGICDSQAVLKRGPYRRIEVPGREVRNEMLWPTLRGANDELLFPIAVGLVRNDLTVRCD